MVVEIAVVAVDATEAVAILAVDIVAHAGGEIGKRSGRLPVCSRRIRGRRRRSQSRTEQ